jgi:hypothetical protein
VKAVEPPQVRDREWSIQPIDRFILAELEANGLRPTPVADRRTLARRLSFLLIGLPPSPEQVEQFVADSLPGAYERMVETMLASPRFGERWARHWLDVVRYAETFGHEFDYPLPHAWRYRDYVIRAFSADLPYNQFIREHIAGDLMEEPRRDPTTGLNESAIATGFFWFGQQAHSPVDIKANQLDLIDNQIDTLSRGFQALTVSCARCHDHKFDAISTKDFYALYGVLSSSRYTQADVGSVPDAEHELEKLARLRAEFVRQSAGAERPDDDSHSPRNPSRGGWKDGVPYPGVGSAADWFFEGLALADAQVRAGDLLFLSPTQSVVRTKVPLVSSRKLSPALQGGLRSPNFVINQRFLHLLVAGHGTRARVILEGFQLVRDPIYGGLRRVIDSDTPGWMTFDLELWRGRRAYLELLDHTTPDLAGDGDSGLNSNGWFDLVDVTLSNDPKPSEDPARFQTVETSPAALEVLAAIDRLAQSNSATARAPGVVESEGFDECVFIRGNPSQPGEHVTRRYLEALGGLDRPMRHGSGREVLADLLASPDNPLTARVWVNRVWHHLFGRGLVPTVDDFGVLGDRPSHPELLDWLADWFVREGEWSTKKLIHMLATSSTWRQSARAADDRLPADPEEMNPVAGFDQLDPDNVLLHRWTVRRLEGEAIRDSILAVSGRLDLTPFGPSVPVHLTDFMTGRGRPGKSGPLDGDGRRSVYLEVRRNFLPPMMLAFDTPQAAQTFGRRNRSNVPAQALTLMNDPFVQQQADLWADRMVNACGPDSDERIDWLYEAAFQRRATPEERAAAREFLDGPAKERTTAGQEAVQRAAWADLCHVLFNTKEFIFVN